MSTTLYASSLPFSTTEDMLAGLFAKFGSVLSVRMERDANGVSRRSAFVEMDNAADAQRAIGALHLSTFEGRVVSVYSAVARVQK